MKTNCMATGLFCLAMVIGAPMAAFAQQDASELTIEELDALFASQRTRGLVLAPAGEEETASVATTDETDTAIASADPDYIQIDPEFQANFKVDFEFDSALLAESEKTELATLCAYLGQGGDSTFRIVGHTDASGSESYNNIGGGLTIRPALLTVTSDDFVKIYGEADPDFDFRISGFVLGEGRSLVTGALGRVAGESVAARRYALTLGTLSAGPNYALRLAGNDGLRIRPATLTVTTDDFVKVYGDDDPEFDFLVSGFVFNDGMSLVSGALGRVSGEDVSARPYRLTLGTLSAGRNYRLQFADRGGLLITQRALTIAADDIGQFFGAQDEPLTWSIVDGRLVFNDTITGGLEREEGSQPGIYAILQGNLTGGPNYAITFEPGTLTISPSEEIRNTERGAKEDTFVDVPELILDPEEEVEVPDQADGDDALNASIEQTDEIVREIEDASSYCSIIGQSEYVVDCLSERLAVIAAKLPTSGDYGPARAAIDQAARQLSALVAANEDRDFPAGLTRSLRPDAPASSRPLRAVRTDSLEETLAAASGIMRNTQTLLLRSIPESAESVHYQRIATSVSTGSTLLRSI